MVAAVSPPTLWQPQWCEAITKCLTNTYNDNCKECRIIFVYSCIDIHVYICIYMFSIDIYVTAIAHRSCDVWVMAMKDNTQEVSGQSILSGSTSVALFDPVASIKIDGCLWWLTGSRWLISQIIHRLNLVSNAPVHHGFRWAQCHRFRMPLLVGSKSEHKYRTISHRDRISITS